MPTHYLDITQEHCPMTIVKTKISLGQLKAGDRLEVLVTDFEALETIPRTAQEQGFRVLSVDFIERDTHKITLEK